MTPITRDENGEGEAMGCDRFQRGRGGGGEATPRCRRQTTQRKAVRRLGRLKAAADVWRSEMTKGNWVSMPNARLDRTANWADKKNMTESMRWTKKIRKGILVVQNRKEKTK
jgi:hypothetical protein